MEGNSNNKNSDNDGSSSNKNDQIIMRIGAYIMISILITEITMKMTNSNRNIINNNNN